MSAECHRFLLNFIVDTIWIILCKAKITARITDRADATGYNHKVLQMYCGDITSGVEHIHSNSLLLFDTIPFPLLNFKTNEGDTAYFGND